MKVLAIKGNPVNSIAAPKKTSAQAMMAKLIVYAAFGIFAIEMTLYAFGFVR